MKKVISILLAVMMLGVIACAASADEVSRPEGGNKFESNWAIAGGLVEIDFEEEGYKIGLDIWKPEENMGSVWQYSCIYEAESDSLKSVSSSRTDYTYDIDTNERTYGQPVYEDFDDENQITEFTIDKDGFLIWKDGREDAGAGLKFMNIGVFDGVWENEAEEVLTEVMWNGGDENEMYYTVYITRGKTDGERYTNFLMTGDYDPATGKLTVKGICTLFTKGADGEYTSEDDGEEYEAVFSKTEDGRVLFETENGIVLDPKQDMAN